LLRLAGLRGACGPPGLGEAILGGSPLCGLRREDLVAFLIGVISAVVQGGGDGRRVDGLVDRLLGGVPLLI